MKILFFFAGLLLSSFLIAQENITSPNPSAYLHVVYISPETGLPPKDSPFYDVICSRNKKAVNTRGQRGNRIMDSLRKNVYFPIREGAELIDGFTGQSRGKIKHRAVQINVGSRKIINGKMCSFAFNVVIGKRGISGWIYEDDILDTPLKEKYYADIALNLNPEPVLGDAPERYRIIKGDPATWGEPHALKVRRNIPRKAHVAVTDYLAREDGTVYLLYALPFNGGFANDAVIGDKGAIFIPDAGMPRVLMPVFLPRDPKPEEIEDYRTNTAHQTLEFVFGRIGSQRGWIAALNLQKIQ